jgi:hypothetical protein
MSILFQGLIALGLILAIVAFATWIEKKFDHWDEE